MSGCLSEETASSTDVGPSATDSGSNTLNNPPTISGSPDPAVLAGDSYEFTPSAGDSDGDPLVFSISNKPVWADFDSTSGMLSGTTTLANVGSYDNIRISVSDGNVSQSLPEFSISVSQVGLGSMSLSWTPPTENSDGSALTDLAGYKLYYGESSGSYDKSVRIDNPSISTYVIDNLIPDTYYVAATSFNAAGIESTFSNEAVKTVASN